MRYFLLELYRYKNKTLLHTELSKSLIIHFNEQVYILPNIIYKTIWVPNDACLK